MIKFLLFVLAMPLSLQAATLCIDDSNLSQNQDGSARYPYRSIQAAVTAATAFDTLLVAAGSYSGIDNMGKPLTMLGGYTGGNSAAYDAGTGGNFSVRTPDPSLTIISGGAANIGVNLTRFDSNPFSFVFDNFTVSNSRKGIVFDVEVSFPHAGDVTISNNIIKDNGQEGITTYGAGIVVAGNRNKLLNNIISNNRGGRGPGISGNFSPTDSLLIEGNLIDSNTGYDDHGAGVYVGGYITLRNNVISGNYLQNTYGWGGGVLILGRAYMSFNVIKDNFCPSYGGAVFVDEGGIAYMDHELIYNNSTALNGAAIAVDNSEFDSSHVYLTNCTIANNYSPGDLGGNALYLDNSSFGTLKNCILAGNGDDFYMTSTSAMTATYTLSQEGFTGVGNFKADPLFADTVNEDFHLKSLSGRYSPGSQTWINDNVHSPAIDAGDVTSANNLEPAPNGNRVNLGCYGNTIYASKSSTTDINDRTSEDAEITVFPNPFSLQTTIRTDKNYTAATLVLYNNIGQKVETMKNISGQTIMLYRNNLPNGLYFLRISQGIETMMTTIVISD